MNDRRGVRRYFRRRPQRDEVGAHVGDEIDTHLELRVQRLMAGGMPEAAARREAESRFGELARTRRALERTARQREVTLSVREGIAAWWQDVRFGTRALRREPLFSSMVIVTLALGIGANATMFGIVDRLLLRGPAHVTDAERVSRLYLTSEPPGMGTFTTGTVGYVMYELLRDRTSAFERVAAFALRDATLGLGPGAREVRIGYATWDLFPLLGVRPVLGRFFNEAEDRPGSPHHVVVIDEATWQSEFGGARDVVGRTLDVAGTPFEVIGVAPAGFTGPQLESVGLWRPMSTYPPPSDDWRTGWNVQWLGVVARLRVGVTPERAAEEVTTAYAAAYEGGDEADAAAVASLRPIRYSEAGNEQGEIRVARWLLGVSLVVLLIACANVANLMLARAVRRRREVGIRLALGISRRGLARLLLTESAVLSLVAGVVALACAHWGGAFMRATLLPAVHWPEPPLSARVLAVTVALVLLVTLATGLLPALQATRQDLTTTLKSGAREGGAARSRVRVALTVAQAALSVVLLVGAGLFLRSLDNVRRLDLGLEPDRVLAVSVTWPGRFTFAEDSWSAEQQRRARVWDEVLASVQAMPEIEAAALTIGTPFRSWFARRLRVPGIDSIPRLPGGGPYLAAVTADYFRTTGVAIGRGRAFRASDRAGSEPVAIVSDLMARTLWPQVDALGKCLLIGNEPAGCARIVGIAESARRSGIREDVSMQYYIPLGQEEGMAGTALLIRPRPEATGLEGTLRRRLHALDSSIGFVRMASLQDEIAPEIRPWRLGATMFALFGALALLIAAVGLYSVIAYGVAQRRAELGIRAALGARAANIVGMVVREGVALVVAGTALGVVIALLAGRSLETLLFDTSARDLPTFAVVVGTLLVVAVVASLVPAIRAGRVDPMEAVRGE